MRPLIGITTSVNTRDYETPDQEVVMLPHNYPEAIRRAGGTPLLITEGEVDGSLLDSLDGIIISGGRDISPALYGEEPHERTNDVRPEQDASELSLMRAALERDLPFLAVCRGFGSTCSPRKRIASGERSSTYRPSPFSWPAQPEENSSIAWPAMCASFSPSMSSVLRSA